MSIIDDTITRLQQIALEVAGVKSAPQTPPESAAVLPMAEARIAGGQGTATVRGDAQLILNIHVGIHVSMTPLKSAYTQLDAIIPAFMQRLCGDPTLNSEVTTIVYPFTFEVNAAAWSNTQTIMAAFTIPCKFRLDSIE